MIEHVASVVLAGGEARRLGGGDKTLRDVAGSTILARILARLETRRVAISANGDPARFASFGLPVLDDGAFAGNGPLAGVLAGLDWAATLGVEALLTVPGDVPLLPSGLVADLSPAPAYAASQGRIHPLVALWPVACRAALREHLSARGPRHVIRFAERIGMRRVDFATTDWDPFLNVNTPGELALARSIAKTGAERGN